jgi:hypothetical protein
MKYNKKLNKIKIIFWQKNEVLSKKIFKNLNTLKIKILEKLIKF